MTRSDHAVLAMAIASVLTAITLDNLITRVLLAVWWFGASVYWIVTGIREL